MDITFNNTIFSIPEWLVIGMGVITAFSITYVSIPTIITVAHKLGLYERSNDRDSHDGNVPTLGGVAIFAGIVVAGAIFANQTIVREFQYILGALVILFFIGIKDDLLIMDPRKKLIAQILASLLVVILGDVRITNFHGFANIHEVSYIFSVVFTVFVFIVIINGFNLIDGIDGLASGITIVTALTFGIWFITVGRASFSIVPLGLAASVLAFFRYNVFSKKNRIFLGDTGSLSIGLIMAVIAIRFLEYHDPHTGEHTMLSAPAVAVGILIVPLFDTLRVFTIRIFGGDSPFTGDRRHIHHRLLELGFSHLRATLLIVSINIGFILMSFLFRDLGNLKLLIMLFVLAAVLSYIPVLLVNRKLKKV